MNSNLATLQGRDKHTANASVTPAIVTAQQNRLKLAVQLLLTLHTPGRWKAFLGIGEGGTRGEKGDKLAGRRIRVSYFQTFEYTN